MTIAEGTWVRLSEIERLQRTPSMTEETSSLNSSALCNAPFILASSISRAAICPAGSLCPRAASRLR